MTDIPDTAAPETGALAPKVKEAQAALLDAITDLATEAKAASGIVDARELAAGARDLAAAYDLIRER